MQRLLTRQHLAELFGASLATIDRWTAQGRIPKPFRVGRRLYWSAVEVEQFIAEQSGEPPHYVTAGGQPKHFQ